MSEPSAASTAPAPLPSAIEKAASTSRGARLAALFMLVIALIGLWKLSSLERWSIEGPGPGLFPMLVAGVFAALAIIVLIWPGQVSSSADDDVDENGAEAGAANTQSNQTRTFRLYAISLLMLAFGSAFAGFTITALAVSVIVVRFAERRSWFAAISYGLICAAIGLIGFGWLLRVDLPNTAIERAFFSLVR